MKKKLLWLTGTFIVTVVLILGIWRYVEVRQLQTDPYWKIAEQIYNMGNALKELDQDYECKFISKVIPYTYQDSAGNTIIYYCCQTTYATEEHRKFTGLDTEALGLVVDFAKMENKRNCTVNEYDAIQCEIEELSYLCWTLSPECSCVIAYNADAVDEADIFRMAESVQLLA